MDKALTSDVELRVRAMDALALLEHFGEATTFHRGHGLRAWIRTQIC